MEHTDFQLASGGVIGRDHRGVNLQKNGNDAFCVVRDSLCTVAIVADGCGSSLHSEVGAKLGARLLSEAIRREVFQRELHERELSDINWERVQQDLLSALNVLALQMGGSFRQTVEDYFLFTVVGVLLAGETATFFVLGDGVIIVNGQMVFNPEPFPGNKPPYAGYGLIGGSVEGVEGSLAIQAQGTLPLEALDSFLIGSDGVNDFIVAADKNLPGLNELVGPIDQFWQNDRFFDPDNPDNLPRRLRLISRDWPRRDSQPGLLKDDTTIIVGRWQPTPGPREE